MALFDIFKKGKKGKVEDKLKRPSKGVFKQPKQEKKAASPKAGEPRPEDSGREKKDAGVKESSSELASRVILSPHITEKTTLSSEKGSYAFRVASRANKIMIKQAIKELYGFNPRKVRITNMPSKTRFTRKGSKTGFRSGFKKAVVYLKEGDKIDLA